MYDITKIESFDSISEWVKNIYQLQDNDFPFILIGNKCDLADKRVVSEEEGLEAAEKYKTTYFETSAKEGINVEKAIEELLNKIIKKNEENSIDSKNEKSHNSIKLEKEKTVNKKIFKCC